VILVPYLRFLLLLRSNLQDLHKCFDGRDATRSDILGLIRSIGFQLLLATGSHCGHDNHVTFTQRCSVTVRCCSGWS